MPSYSITFKQQRGHSVAPVVERLNLYFIEKIRGEVVAYHAGKYLLEMLPYAGPATIFDTFSLGPIQIDIAHLNTGTKTLQVRRFTFKRTNKDGLFTDWEDRNFTIIDNETRKSISINSTSHEVQLEPKVIIPNPPKNPEISTPMGGAVKKRK